MRYLSVCSGIEAATVAWHHIGWTPVAFSDIEPFPSAVLAHHYPHVPNLGDMTKFEEWNLESVGLRKGLADPRGNLMLTFLAIAQRQRPRWIVWENVPGVLSSNGGRDFGTFLGALGELGYGFAYRVLDAQWFGVAQRRRRVFVVGYFGDWQRPAQVLFESESVRRDTPPSREARKGTAAIIEDGAPVGGIPDVAETLIATDHKGPGHNRDHNFVAQPIGFGAQMSVPQTDVDLMQTLQAKNPMAVAQPVAFTRCDNGQDAQVDVTPTMRCGSNYSAHLAVAQPVAIGLDEEQNARMDGFGTLKARTEGGGFEGSVMTPAMQVRRLTPVECERLQGFPDNYTNIPWRKKPEAPDGPRYKALGNSMAVPVMRWIGERINRLEVSHPSNALPSVAVKRRSENESVCKF
jgi:DNA (cytosine-5)-methyltransferase 1